MRNRQVELTAARRRRTAPIAAALVASLATLLAFGGAQALAGSLPALHVADGQIRDSYGRQVVLRGVNVTALTDQYQVDPDLPTVVPLHRSDYRQMQRLGFNVIRLAITWSSLEPERGVIDRGYIDKIAKVVRRASEHGIYTIIDMHNGGWGKDVATPPGERCPGKNSHKSHGWLGAPAWATFLDGESTCHNNSTIKRTPAVKQAWNNFWNNRAEPVWLDGRGIQDHLVDAWAALANAFAGAPAVAGYDLLNEPDPGTTRDQQQGFVTSFTADAIAAIRGAEAQAGGFSHMVFFEPNLLWSANGLPSHSPTPGFSSDPNLVFAPHLYGRDAHSTSRPLRDVRHDLRMQERRVARRAARYGVALWIGEWAFATFDENALKKLRIHTEIQDAHALGSAWWQWKVACGAPQAFDGVKPKPSHHVIGNLNLTECPSGEPIARPQGWNAIIARAYPQAAPGTITRLRAHGSHVSLAGESGCTAAQIAANPKACELKVWIPRRKHDPKARPQIDGRNLGQVSIHRIDGGWLAKADVRGSYTLTSD